MRRSLPTLAVVVAASAAFGVGGFTIGRHHAPAPTTTSAAPSDRVVFRPDGTYEVDHAVVARGTYSVHGDHIVMISSDGKRRTLRVHPNPDGSMDLTTEGGASLDFSKEVSQ